MGKRDVSCKQMALLYNTSVGVIDVKMNDGSGSTKNATSRGKHVLALLNKWLVWRFGALCFWYWFITLRGRTLALPPLQNLGLLALLPVLRHFFHRKWWLGLLAIPGAVFYYFVIFPIIGAYWTARLAKRALVFPGRAVRVATSTKGFLISAILFVLFLALIPSLSNRMGLLVLGFLNLTVTNVLFVCGLVWANSPLKPLIEIFRRLWQLSESLISCLAKTTLQTSPQSSVQIAQSFADWLRKYVVDEKGRLRRADRLISSIGPIFGAAVIVLFLILVSGYGVTYLALHRSGLGLLQGLGEWPSFGTAWYLSLTISVTALHVEAIPISPLGRLIQSLQFLNTAMFLGLTLFLFNYAMGSRGRREIRALWDAPRRLMERLEELIAQLQSQDALSLPNAAKADSAGTENSHSS